MSSEYLKEIHQIADEKQQQWGQMLLYYGVLFLQNGKLTPDEKERKKEALRKYNYFAALKKQISVA